MQFSAQDDELDRDVERAAKWLRGKHGTGAAEVALARARELEFNGDLQAAETWRRVARAINRLPAPN
jgi:hypothetical protein